MNPIQLSIRIGHRPALEREMDTNNIPQEISKYHLYKDDTIHKFCVKKQQWIPIENDQELAIDILFDIETDRPERIELWFAKPHSLFLADTYVNPLKSAMNWISDAIQEESILPSLNCAYSPSLSNSSQEEKRDGSMEEIQSPEYQSPKEAYAVEEKTVAYDRNNPVDPKCQDTSMNWDTVPNSTPDLNSEIEEILTILETIRGDTRYYPIDAVMKSHDRKRKSIDKIIEKLNALKK